MHSKLLSVLVVALFGACQAAQAAPWIYRGSLNDGGKPANGSYDLRLTLTDAAGVRAIGQPLTLYGVAVKDGNFAADVDFSVDLSNAPALKLKTEVAQNGSGFVSLGEPTRFEPKAALAGICWDTTGNVVAAGEFLGSTNNVAVDIRSNNLRAAQFKAAGSAAAWGDAPQVVLGSASNIASDVGATVAGGGATRSSSGVLSPVSRNSASNQFATVGGGLGNDALGVSSLVAGGDSNRAAGKAATIGGGSLNSAEGDFSVVSGGLLNRAQGYGSAVVGGTLNCAGANNSWAGGTRAIVRPGTPNGICTPGGVSATGDEGTFVWSGIDGTNFTSTGTNQFLVRAQGGMAINTNTPISNTALTVSGNQSLSGNLSMGGDISVGGSATVTGSSVLGGAAFLGNNLNVSGSTFFGSTPRQMLNLFNSSYGIGIQGARMYFRAADTGGFNWFEGGVHSNATDDPGAGGTLHMRLSQTGQLQTTTGTISSFSDARLKSDVDNYSGALDQIAALRPVHYRYTDAGKEPFQPEGTHLGFIAQEVQQVFPEWVSEDESGYLMLSMRGFEAVAVRGMQELQAENVALRAESRELRARLDAIEAKLASPQ